jgi:CDGSH-type Zn-finger protein
MIFTWMPNPLEDNSLEVSGPGGEVPDPAMRRDCPERIVAVDKPKIAGRKPIVVELPAGQYAFCACGESKNQPFCDGAHRTTPFKPELFNLKEEKTVALCACKRSAGGPYCDGSHAKLESE